VFYQSGLRVFEISPQFEVIGRLRPDWLSRGGVVWAGGVTVT